MANIVLATELTVDPLARGYAGMANHQARADSLNTANRTLTVDVLSSAQIYEAIDVSEFQALTDAQKAYVRDILGLGDSVAVGTGNKARTVLIGAFGGGSTTISALAALLDTTVSRAVELGLGLVEVGHIIDALA